jgi:hypothetical protein
MLVLPLLGWSVARADEVASAKQRIDARQSAIAALKDRGMLGENNRGFVEPRGALSHEENELAASENGDRGILYAAVAKRTGQTAELAGRARAKQIAQNSKAGVWLQDESGGWHRK